MDASIPESVSRWMRSTEDPWHACERADWLVYVARHRGCSVRHVVQALARNMPPLLGPAELRDVTEPLRDLTAACAAGERPAAALAETIRLKVRPRVVDWNVARQYQGPAVPHGVPRRATAAEEPVRASANATLRLWKVLESDEASDEAWPALVLVAQYIVFARAAAERSPFYNYVDGDITSARELSVHQDLCDALRADLLGLGGA